MSAFSVVLFLIGGSAKAQDRPRITDPASESGGSDAEANPSRTASESAPVERGFLRVRLHDGTVRDVHKPTFREVADRNFWFVVAGSYATSVLNIEGLHHCANVDPSCREANPLLGSHRAQEYGVKMPLNALFVLGLYRYKRAGMIQHETGVHSHTPPWWLVGNTWTALNVATSIHNWRHTLACPSGTSCSAFSAQ